MRLRSGSENYGSYLRFGDGNYCYLYEDTDDHLKIYGSKGVEITTGSGYNLTWNNKTVATQEWVNSNYLSIAFFCSLFRAYNSSSVEIVPNSGDTSTIDNIKAMFGFWTNQYISALGHGSGGSGGATALSDLVDVTISSPSNGQALVYDSSLNKWKNATIQQSGGTVTSITAGIGLSGGTITNSGTIAISSTYQTYISNGNTAYGWGNHANAGYLTSVAFSDLTSHPTTLSGYGITDANISSGTITLGSNTITPLTSSSSLNASNINSGTIGFSYLPTLYWANVAVSNQSSNTTEPQFAHVRLRSGSENYGSYLRFGDCNYVYLNEDSDDHLVIYGNKGVEITTGSSYNLTWNSKTVATQEWVGNNYLSIAFFRSLFRAYNSSSVEVVPNSGDTTTIDSIKAMFGFWTNQYLSALGQNSSGGGGGSLSLDDLLDVDITSPSSGQVLKYNGTKWVNAAESGGGGTTLNQPLSAINNAGLGTPTQSGVAIMWNGSAWAYQVPGGGSGGGGTVTSVGLSVPTGFSVSGSPVTGSGTLTLGFASGYRLLNSEDETIITYGYTAYGWGNHADAGYATQTWVTNKHYLTSITSSMVTTALGFTPLSNATTFWGRTVSNGVVSGNINMSSGDKIINDSKTLLEYDGTQVTLAYGFRTTCHTQIHGTNVIFYASGTEKARVTSTGLQIGSAVLAWDSSNNALKVQKSDGTACNLYALGGVSALGFQAGTGGTDSATISDLTSELVTLTFLGSNDCTLENDDGNLILDTDGNSGYVKVCDLCSIDGDQFWEIRKSGIAIFSERVRSPRFYLDGTRYIYLDGTTLKYYNGTTSKTIVLS